MRSLARDSRLVAVRVFCCLSLMLLLNGCALASLRNPVPAPQVNSAVVLGNPNLRFTFDDGPSDSNHAVRRLGFKHLPSTFDAATGQHVVNLLAISGGADDGAYGAGLLTGWTETGKRPRFDIVTGISAGALIAPFAFLGRDYDPQLRAMWLSYTPNDIYKPSPLSGLLGGPALADSSPLANLIAKYVTPSFLAAVAREYQKGRFLFIGTTNLDTQKFVIWNMGEIARCNHPDALEMFRQILLASSAVPGVFPPVQIEVSANGNKHEELHVDGGVSAQVFLMPTNASLRLLDKFHETPVQNRVFVIRNAILAPVYKAVPDSVFPVSQRSISTLIFNSSMADVQRIYLQSVRDGADYNLASIPETFSHPRVNPFDSEYMAALFHVGQEQARSRSAWAKVPPGLPPGIVELQSATAR